MSYPALPCLPTCTDCGAGPPGCQHPRRQHRPPAGSSAAAGAAGGTSTAAAPAGRSEGSGTDPFEDELEAQAAAIEAEAEREEAAQRRARAATAWTAHKAPDGRVYYHNTEVRLAVWGQAGCLQYAPPIRRGAELHKVTALLRSGAPCTRTRGI